ncbi:MAG: amidase family protein, partial [Alphaproteobacteria bacterium]
MLDYGAAMPAPKLALAVEQLRQGRIAIRSVFDQADLVLCPTTPQAAFALTDPAPPSQADFLGLAVFVGAPAISVPVAATDLPVGMQIISAPGHDYALLTYAGKFTGDR